MADCHQKHSAKLLPLSSSHFLFFSFGDILFCQLSKLNQFIIQLKECQSNAREGMDSWGPEGVVGTGNMGLSLPLLAMDQCSWTHSAALSLRRESGNNLTVVNCPNFTCCLNTSSCFSVSPIHSLLPSNAVFRKTYTCPRIYIKK